MPEFLHKRADFSDLLNIVAERDGITPTLVEKDYWIMHCLWGLKNQEFQFELKGGTSLSKGFGIIKRFSEDIDIRFEPPAEMDVKIAKNHDKDIHIESRRRFYDWLAEKITIPDVNASRATEYDDARLRNAGIRLTYETRTQELKGVKPGILLEVGFDDTAPNTSVDIPRKNLCHLFLHKVFATLRRQYRELLGAAFAPKCFSIWICESFCGG